MSSVLILARRALSEVDPALVGSLYVYWTVFCIYLLYLARPHSLNIVKYQTFFTPWRYRRDHVSHMRLDRLRRACQHPSALGDVSKPDSPSNLIPVFIDIATAGTIALAVTPATTVQDIREAVCRRGFSPCHSQGPIYLMGLWRPLRAGETMAALGIRGLRHFIMPPRLRGGATGSMSVRADGTVVNEHGWEQGALNPDGSSKSAEDIDFGEDPGTPPSGASGSTRPKRGKDRVFQAALKAQAEDSDEGQQRKKRKARPRARPSAKGKEKEAETVSDADDSAYSRSESDDDSDSDPDATITHEELAAGLPTKTVPAGSSRRPKDGESKRTRKKRKTQHPSDESLNPAPSNAATAPSNTADADEKKSGKPPSPMWLFWEEITKPEPDAKGQSGDKFYRCRHGESKKPQKMTKAMKGSLTGLIGHLKTHAPDMYRFYEILNGKYKTTPLTEEETAIAEGRRVFADRKDFKQFLNGYTSHQPGSTKLDTYIHSKHGTFSRMHGTLVQVRHICRECAVSAYTYGTFDLITRQPPQPPGSTKLDTYIHSKHGTFSRMHGTLVQVRHICRECAVSAYTYGTFDLITRQPPQPRWLCIGLARDFFSTPQNCHAARDRA
ncbi:hypothetical protein B0H10DRAFT_2233267 [Mycena sp. CBHHK59/15]|nr:hypothetical protein B0H10DRAFT_2233267 [Mycena sp. CBHHK59/15]